MSAKAKGEPEVRSLGAKPRWAARLRKPETKRQYILSFSLGWLIVILTLWLLSELVGGGG